MAHHQVPVRRQTACARGAARGQRSIPVGLLLVTVLSSAVAAEARYRVDVGDVIEIVVARIPELQRRVTVRPDGSISFPLLGSVAVAGLTPSQLEMKIQSTLASKVFQKRTADGKELDVLIDRDEVTATVVEFRPIYVKGDVARPGAHPYRPSMTVRQVIALSGGYDVLRGGTANPYLVSLDLRGEYEALWGEFAKEQARVWRIERELGVARAPDPPLPADIPLPRSTLAKIAKVEAEHLSAREADFQRQNAFLRNAISRGEEQLHVLAEAQQKEAQGAQADAEELARVMELYGKGSLPSPRVTDARRAVLLSATRQLQTTTQLLQLRRQQDDLARQAERLEDQRKIELLRELQEAGVRRDALRAKLQTIEEKLKITSLQAQAVHGENAKPEIVIVRKGERGREHLNVDEDAELQPDDVVEVVLRAKSPDGVPE